MYVLINLVSYICALTLTGVAGSGLSTCARNYEKVGCYDEYSAGVKDLLVNDRYRIKWANIVGYMHHLACTCEAKVREMNTKRSAKEQYVGFALHFWGECYGRTQAHMDSLASKTTSERCTGDQTYKKCYPKNPECTGHASSEFIYKLKPGKGDIRTLHACDLHNITISCDKGTVDVQNVSYGKRTSSQCGKPLSAGWVDSCQKFAPQNQVFFKSDCAGHSSCEVADWTFDPKDPCPKVEKFFKIDYICKH